jgi:hypothetical protein
MDQEFKTRSNEELLEEVREDIKREKEKISFDEILEFAKNEAEESRKKVIAMKPKELAQWLIDKHDDFVLTMNIMLKTDCMDGHDFDDRSLKIVYMNELNNLLWLHNIDDLSSEVIEELKKENAVDLLNVLHVLNYI